MFLISYNFTWLGLIPLVRVSMSRRSEPVLWILLAAAAGVIAWLSHQKREADDRAIDLFQRVSQPYTGMPVPRHVLTTINGDTVAIGGGEADALVLVFTTTCNYCEASIPAWNSLPVKLPSSRVIGVTAERPSEVEAYVRTHSLQYQVAFAGENFAYFFRAYRVPLIALIHEGKIAYWRAGALQWPSAAYDSLVRAVRSSGG